MNTNLKGRNIWEQTTESNKRSDWFWYTCSVVQNLL